MDAAHVVNPRGAVHSVNDDMVETLLREGYRLATDEEISAYYKDMGLTYGSKVVDDGHNRPNSKNDKRSRSDTIHVD